MSRKARLIDNSRKRSASCPHVAQRCKELLDLLEQTRGESVALADDIKGLTPEQRALFTGGVSSVGRDARHAAWVLEKLCETFEGELPFEARHGLPDESAA